MTRQVVTSGDAKISARLDGDEGKPFLLLSNSLAADMHMWDDQILMLTRTHQVIRYDTRGHGRSSAPEGPYSFDMLVGDMVAVLDHFGADKADVMGLSLGGMTALGLGLSHADRVGQMVVCDARADNPPPFVSSWDDRIAAINEGGMAAIAEGTLARWFTEDCPKGVRDRAEAMILATEPTGYIGCARALQTLNYLKDLGQLGMPVLYVVGEEDMGAPKAAMEAMAAATPDAELVVLPALAHIPNMEDPQAFDAAVEPFLQAAARKARA
ncbi:alpha/beta fold hydrolase [Pelagibacterium montanilacus]|uniref:alpha/beta fold hydrolase n=1 Tax=Pelagibacterium montanilacus TaxID=2185280 RepID=UPI000F8CCE5F|nr:alpha/beta fold hydrolase [Pelagibacterium montanilacus]